MSGPNMLLLSAGRRVSLLRGFQDVFRDRGGSVCAADVDPDMSAACQVADAAYQLPHVSDSTYLDALQALCISAEIGLVVPTIDTELLVLAESRRQLEASGVRAVVSDPRLIAVCGDKRTTAKFFVARGLRTPRIYGLEQLQYPAIAKPYDGSLSADITVLREPDDLTDAIKSSPRMIFCEYIDHDLFSEFTCDMYYSLDHKLRCVVPRERLSVRGGEVAKARAVKNEIVDMLFEHLGTVQGARGCLTLQLFRNPEDQTTSCIEINARFGGGYPLSRHAGADFQQWIVAEYLDGEPVQTFLDWSDGLTMLRYDEEVIVHV